MTFVMNNKKTVLSVGGNAMTMDEVSDLFGMSDSDDSDWGGMEEIKVDDFVVDSKKSAQSDITVSNTVKPIFNSKINTEKVKPNNTEKPKPSVNLLTEIQRKSLGASQKLIHFVATPTNIRAMNPRLSIENWKERIMDRQVVSASDLCKGNIADRLVDTDWIMVGVVAQRSGTKKTKTDKNYSIWMVNDLKCLDKAVRFMLFDDVHNVLCKEQEGTVVAILRPKVLPTNKEYTTKSYTVDLAAQVIVLGQSPDFGICEARKKNGDKCTNVVNKSECGLCLFHVQQGYSAAVSRPGFGDIRKQKLDSRKRTAPTQEWQMSTKKLKSNGIYVNNLIGSALSMEKLHKSGVTDSAAKWGLLDADAVSKFSEPSSNGIGNKENSVTLTEKEEKFTTMLKKHGAGSLNLVKCIAEKSENGSSVLADKVVRKGRVFDNSRPTAAKNVTFESIRERLKEREILRDDPQKYIELDMVPVKLNEVSSEVYRAELVKLRAAAQAKAAGGYTQMKENNLKEHLKNAGNPSKAVAPVKGKAPLSEEMLKLLRQGSSHKQLADLNKDIEREKKLDHMEKVEKMELKMASIHEKACVFYYCQQCKTKSLGNPAVCVVEGHQVDKEKGFKRFFACLKCKHRLMTLEKYPDQACFKCGAGVFEKTGMSREKEVAKDKVLIDGGEKRWINN